MSTHRSLMQRHARRGITSEQRVTRAEAEQRVLDTLDRERGTRPARIAEAIWPGHTMKAQGAALAAGGILGRMQSRGLVGYARGSTGWIRTD